MILSIVLSKKDILECVDVTRELVKIHHGKEYPGAMPFLDPDVARTYRGILAVMAAVQIFNRRLGSKQQVKFNSDYIDGFDGGYDFKWYEWTIDVKYSTKCNFDFVKRKKADMYLFMTKGKRPQEFVEVGIVPSSRVGAPGKPVYLESLKRVFPERFHSFNVFEPKRSKDLTPIKSIIGNYGVV